MKMKNNRTSENGSVFIYILIGVALFAALSITLSQSLRTSSGDAGSGANERRDIAYVELTSFLESLKMRTYQMEYTNGLNETQIDFVSASYLFGNDLMNCWNENASCSTASCRVFSPENPQGLRPTIFNNITSTLAQTSPAKAKNGHLQLGQLIIEGVGSPKPEMVVTISGVSPSFCNYYNSKQGITTTFTDTTQLEDIGESTGSSTPAGLGGCEIVTTFNTNKTIGDQYAPFKGRKTFCSPLEANTHAPTLKILYVLKAR